MCSQPLIEKDKKRKEKVKINKQGRKIPSELKTKNPQLIAFPFSMQYLELYAPAENSHT